MFNKDFIFSLKNPSRLCKYTNITKRLDQMIFPNIFNHYALHTSDSNNLTFKGTWSSIHSLKK